MTIMDLAQHLKWNYPTITPLRLQKTLYFLFAFYGASYGQMSGEDNISEMSYPRYLFNGYFEAWKFGAVNRDIYETFQKDQIEGKEWAPKDEKEKNVLILVNEVLKEIDKLSDFELVDRSHQDYAWSKAWNDETSNVMDNDLIINDYLN